MDYDVLVIGAGLGGLAAGAAMAGSGNKVLVLEKMGFVGGRCSTAEKDGFKMDIGSHMIWRTDYGPFTEALKRVGMEKEVEFHHMENCLFKVGDTSLKLNLKEFVSTTHKLVPTFLLKMIGAAAPVLSGFMDRHSGGLDRITIRDWLLKYTDNLPLHNTIHWVAFLLFGTPYYETPMGEFARTVMQVVGPLFRGISEDSMMTGYIKGGLSAVPEALSRGIEKHGGEVRTGTGVKRVVVENGRVAGVETDSGELIKTNLVFSNGGIKETVKYLVGEDKFEKDYAEYIRSLKPGCAAWCLRLALDEPFVEYDLTTSIPEKDFQEYMKEMWNGKKVPDGLPAIMASSPSRMDPSLAPEGKQNLIVVSAITFDPEENWERWEQKALDSIEDVYPGIKEHIMWHDFLAPGTYMVFGEERAPAIGLAQCMGQAGAERPSSKSPIEGLYYVGAEAGRFASGVATELATQSGLNAADYVLAQTEYISPLKKFMPGAKRKMII
ncbi:MAG: NAD(P)/FAD-dependent oxidoreductase [Actinobacteria bacterium]|nr:NAD(P)/FAD-dependent oxidoreductase [Actinomycetota bacterium]